MRIDVAICGVEGSRIEQQLLTATALHGAAAIWRHAGTERAPEAERIWVDDGIGDRWTDGAIDCPLRDVFAGSRIQHRLAYRAGHLSHAALSLGSTDLIFFDRAQPCL